MAFGAQSTQDFVPIKEIRDGVVILEDGGMRAVLMASAVNLSLKSNDEQEGTIYMFQNFLNSIDFSIQIVVQSRRLDIGPYLKTLEAREDAQVEPLLKVQTREYMQFIKNFTDEVNIMTKQFFVVVPYSASVVSAKKGIFASLFGKTTTNDKEDMFDEAKTQLEQRVGTVKSGLSRIGVRSTLLGTEEDIELFYKTFNPGDTISIKSTEEK
jgi:hypothetical protein